jgi:hypothetical protein
MHGGDLLFHSGNGLKVHVLKEITIKALVEALLGPKVVVLSQEGKLTLQNFVLSILDDLGRVPQSLL